VLVWSIADHVTTLTATGKMHNAVKGERLQNRTKLEVQAPPSTLRHRFAKAGMQARSYVGLSLHGGCQ